MLKNLNSPTPPASRSAAARQREALIAITEQDPHDDLGTAYRFLTELTAETLNVERVSIWDYRADVRSIRCLDLYIKKDSSHTTGAELFAREVPGYFDAILSEKVIVADEAYSHPATFEFAESYLEPLRIRSMLDAPIRVNGGLFGVICCESVGEQRRWTADEQSFAVAVANSVALAIERVHRAEAEATLRTSEERLRSITDSALDAIVMMDDQGTTTFWNPAAERMTGYMAGEAVGKELVELIAPERLRRSLRKALKRFVVKRMKAGNGRPIEVILRRKDNSEFTAQISVSISTLNGRIQPTAIVRDITEKKRVEEELRNAHLKFEKMLRHSPAISFHLKLVEGTWLPVAISENITRILGYDLESAMAVRWWFDALHPDDLDSALSLSNSPATPVIRLEYRVRHRDGSYRWIADNRRILFDRDGNPKDVLGVWLDITERKTAELQLAENREAMLLQTAALESAANGIVITDVSGTIEWVNKAFCRLTGYEPDEIIGQNPRILKSGKHSKEVFTDLWETILKGKVWRGDLINRRKDGSLYHEEITITPVPDGSGMIRHFVAIKNDVTEQRIAAEELRQSEAALAKAQEIAHMGHWEMNLETGLATVSAEGRRILGLDPVSKGHLSIEAACRHIHIDDKERFGEHVLRCVRSRRWEPIEYRVIRQDGTTGIILAEGMFVDEENAADLEKLTGVLFDITARKEQDERFKAVVESANDGILLISSEGEITGWNKAAGEMFGYDEAELPRLYFADLFVPEMDERSVNHRDYKKIFGSGTLCRECRGVNLIGMHREGRKFQVEVTVSSWESRNGLLRSAIIRDISERKALEDKLAYQAMHDGLTGLPNRLLFHDRVGHALKRINRTKATLGVLFVDLDNFKFVNDTLGHAAGDELLCRVAQTIKECLRSGDTAARLGGDEFGVLVEDSDGLEGAVQVAQRIIDTLAAPFEWGTNRVFVSASIGIAITSADTDTPEGLLQNADVAMYSAKSAGKNRFVVFESPMLDSVLQRVQLESELRSAIEREEFLVYYQPIVDLENGELAGVEALLRWDHPRTGVMAPGEFIGVAEDTHLIVPIGKWALEAACRQVREWQKRFREFEDLCLTVNVATPQFLDDRFVDTVTGALRSSGFPASLLALEITESAMMANTEKTRNTLARLKEAGVKLAIDDFGTGYSSLSYLRQFPIDVIKIDKSFIDSLAKGSDGSAVARAIIAMGDSLNLKTVAEGIETKMQQAELRKLGCRYGQGYRFSRPLCSEDLLELLDDRSRRLWTPSEFEVTLSSDTSYVC